MLIVFAKSQFPLFDAPVQVAQHVRKDGTLVAQHTRIQKVAIKRPAASPQHQASLFGDEAEAKKVNKPSKLDAWIAKRGGAAAVARILSTLTDVQQQQLLDLMAKIAGQTAEDVAKRFDGLGEKAPEKGETPDLFAQPAEPDPVLNGSTPEPEGLAEAKLLYREYVDEGIARVGSMYVQAPFERKVRLFSEKLSPGATEAREVLGRMFNGRYGNKPPEPKRFEGVAGDRLQGALVSHLHEKGIIGDKPAPATKPAKFATGDIIKFKDRTGKFVQARVDSVEGWQGTVMASVVSVPPRSPFKVGTSLRRTFDSVQLEHRPEVAAAPDPMPAAAPAAPAQAAAAPAPAPTAPFGVPAGITKQQRRDINAKVAALVRDGQTDLDLMRQYSGNGGCGDSLNEFYTDPDIARSMWSVIERLAGPGGTALEPSCATGVFLHTAPAGYRVTGVEMDPISQACAAALHGDRHEVAAPQSMERFAKSDGGRQFKVVIGNPPYGPRGSLAKDDKSRIKTAEAYFIDTALDKCEPGGIVALVVPASVMNNKNGRAFRERMLRKGEFLGAQRMPNTAFEASHTDVTADVIWLRKRPDDVAGALMTVEQATLKKLGVWDDEFLSGGYFEGRGAENLFGRAGTAMRSFGEIYTVNGSMNGVPEQIAQFEPRPVGKTPTVNDIVEALGDDEKAVKKAMGGAMVRPYADGKKGDTKVVDGVAYVLQGNPLRWHRVDEVMEHDAVTDAKPLAQMIDRALDGHEVDHASLQADIKAYIGRHGIPVKNQHLVDASAHDKMLHRLIGAVGHDGTLSDAVMGKQERRVEGSIETAAAALAAERNDGIFTVGDLAARSGKSRLEVDELLHASTAYAYAGGGRWTTMDQYLTGDLWAKLDACKLALQGEDLEPGAREKFEFQAKRLDDAIAPKSLEDVEVSLNSAFLPTSVIQAWLEHRWAELKKSTNNGSWLKHYQEPAISYEGSFYTLRGYNVDLLDKYLNRTGVRKDDLPTIEAMNAEFKEWLLASNLRDSVEDLYNRKFRGYVEREWSQEPIEVPGLDTAGGERKPNAYHWDSLRWALHQGKGIIADDVGLGKTVRGLMLARLAKMTGKAKKPTFVVPKSVLANWVAEADMWFPGSRVLVIGENYSRDKSGVLKSRPDTQAERNRKYHDLTQNDYDFVFISRPSFNELDVDPVTKNEYLGQDFWVQRGDKLGNAGDKRIKRVREAFEQNAADRETEKRTQAIYFNELPVDMLIVDEGHAYKNRFEAKKQFGEDRMFLGGSGTSNAAFDMGFKAKWLREKNGGKNIYMLTATPTKNSPLEVYSMLSYIAPEEFERVGIRNSEEFIERYCEFKNETVLKLNGAVEESVVTSGFKNMDELRSIMSKYMMRRTAADVGLPLPKPETEMHLVDMSPKQAAVYAELRAQLAEASEKKDATGDAHVFSLMDKMAKAALDLELLDPVKYAGEKSPKYEALAELAAERRKDGGQIVFCENLDAHNKIVDAMVKAGIPRERIGVFNAKVASSSAARQNLSDKFNSGALDVIIGNKTMEEGVNLQKKASDIHHLDIPWEPATVQQRNGRGLRQGNKRATVNIHPWLSRATFDGYRYQSMTAKKSWQDLLWSGGDKVENLNRPVISREDMMIAMSVDPDATREKLANDKAAYKERITVERRVDASNQFVRFQALRRSYNALANKETASARRLRAQIERAKTTLAANPHFTAKGALDSNDEVLIHPSSGEIVTRDMGLDVAENDGTTSRWVVTGVDTKDSTVSMRMYADTTGHKGVTVPLMKLAEGVKGFKFDKAAEAKEVGEKLTAQANEKVNSIKEYKDLMRMPSAVLEANRDAIQAQLKAGAKAYSVKFPDYGGVPMVNKQTGEIENFETYDHAKKHDTHDYLLPTDDAKEKATQAWMAARREARITTEFQKRGRGAGSRSGAGDYVARRNYPGAHFSNKSRNPHSNLLAMLGGDSVSYSAPSALEREARQRLATEQMAAIRGAKSAQDAVGALFPLAKVSSVRNPGDNGYENKAVYPREALMMAWARARHLGQLEDKMTAGDTHSTYATSGGHGQTTHAALIRMAQASGHHDLADAFAETAERRGLHKDGMPVLRALTRHHGLTLRSAKLIKQIAEREGLLDSSLGQLANQRAELGGHFAARAGYNSYGHSAWDAQDHNRKTLRSVVDGLIGTKEREAKKEAA